MTILYLVLLESWRIAYLPKTYQLYFRRRRSNRSTIGGSSSLVERRNGGSVYSAGFEADLHHFGEFEIQGGLAMRHGDEDSQLF